MYPALMSITFADINCCVTVSALVSAVFHGFDAVVTLQGHVQNRKSYQHAGVSMYTLSMDSTDSFRDVAEFLGSI